MGGSIATRLIALLTLCSVVVLGGGILLDYRLSRQQILARLEIESRETIRVVLIDLERLLDGVQNAALFLGKLVAEGDYSRADLQRLARQLVRSHGDIFGAAIAVNPGLPGFADGFAPYYHRRDGVVTAVDLNLGEVPYQRQGWYRQAADAGRPVWVQPYFDEFGARVLMTTFSVPVYRPVAGGEPRLFAVVTADVPLQILHDYLQRLSLGEHGRSLLMNREGVILSARNPDLIMRHYESLGLESGPAFSGALQRALAGEQSAAEVPCPWAGGQCEVVLDTLPSTGWPLAIVYSERELLAPLRDFGMKMALTGLATVLLVALAISLVTRRLTRPLVALAEASDRIARGRLDTPLPAVASQDEVGRLVRSFGAMTRDLQQYIDELEEATRSRSRLEGELDAARQIQMSMLPGGGDAVERSAAARLLARVRPAKTVGGDFYYFRQRGGRLLFAVGDVSDKGVPAALFMAKAISHLELLGEGHPAELLARLNDALVAGNERCMFVTLLVASFELSSGELQFASAGHPAPILVRGDGAADLPQESGPAIGLARGLVFPRCSAQLRPADRLAVYTDGIDEAFNRAGEMYSVERLRGRLALDAGVPAERAMESLFDDLQRFADGAPQSDDITLLLLEIPVAELVARSRFRPAKGMVTAALTWLDGRLAPLALADSLHRDLALLLEEALANIAEHGGLGEGEVIEVCLRVTADTCELEISDPGPPFNPLGGASLPPLGLPADTAAVGGLGLHLIERLSDRRLYRRDAGHNILTLIRHRQDQGAQRP